MPLSNKKEIQDAVFYNKPAQIIDKTRPAMIKPKAAIVSKPKTLKKPEEEVKIQGKKAFLSKK